MRIAPHTVVLAALLALGACAPSADSPTPNIADISTADASSENARLDAWFEDRFLESVRAYPQQLTSLGMDERQDEWPYRLEHAPGAGSGGRRGNRGGDHPRPGRGLRAHPGPPAGVFRRHRQRYP